MSETLLVLCRWVTVLRWCYLPALKWTAGAHHALLVLKPWWTRHCQVHKVLSASQWTIAGKAWHRTGVHIIGGCTLYRGTHCRGLHIVLLSHQNGHQLHMQCAASSNIEKNQLRTGNYSWHAGYGNASLHKMQTLSSTKMQQWLFIKRVCHHN